MTFQFRLLTLYNFVISQKVREQKEAALRKIANAAASAPSSLSPVQTSASDPPSSSGTSSGAHGAYVPGGVSLGAMESAQLVAFLEQQVDRGYDWGPWRVVMSRRLGRPFFYNSITKIGQFAVPPELNVIPSPSQSQASQSSPSRQQHLQHPHHHQQYHEDVEHYMPMQAPDSQGMPSRDHLAASQMAFDQYHATHSSEGAYPGHEAHPLAGNSGNSAPPDAAHQGVVHYDHYLDEGEEESPFHLLWDSNHHELDELDPASFLLPDHNHGHNHGHAGSGSIAGNRAAAGAGASFHSVPATATAPTQSPHTSTAASAFASAVSATAVSTAMDVPTSTPFPRGGGGGGGVAYTDLSATSSLGSAGGPSTPWVVVDDDLAVPGTVGSLLGASHYSQVQGALAATPSSSTGAFSAPVEPTSWACQACTFHNPMTTYTCDMCNTVDTVVQQSFSRPLLRSHQHTPVVSGGFTGRSQRSSQPTTQTKLSGSKTKPPANAAKSTKKTKR